MHWIHKYEYTGFREWGYTTFWYTKCACGSKEKSINPGVIKGFTQPTLKLLLYGFCSVYGVAMLLSYLYVYAIYPFNY